MSDLLAERTGVVSSASNGIERSIARTFAEHGSDAVDVVREDAAVGSVSVASLESSAKNIIESERATELVWQ